MKFPFPRRGVCLAFALLTLLLIAGCAGIGGTNGGGGLSGDALFKDLVRNLVVDNWGGQYEVAANSGNTADMMNMYHVDYLHNCQDKAELTAEMLDLFNDQYTYEIENLVCQNIQTAGSTATAQVAYDRVRKDQNNNQITNHFVDTWHFVKVPTGPEPNQYEVKIYGNQQCGP
jgi:hypothetical protein